MSSKREESGCGNLPSVPMGTHGYCAPKGNDVCIPVQSIDEVTDEYVYGEKDVAVHIQPPKEASIQPLENNASAWVAKARGNTRKKILALGKESPQSPEALKPNFANHEQPVKFEETTQGTENISTDDSAKQAPYTGYKSYSNQPKLVLGSSSKNSVASLSSPPGFKPRLSQNSKDLDLKNQFPSLFHVDVKENTKDTLTTDFTSLRDTSLNNTVTQNLVSVPEPQSYLMASNVVAQSLPEVNTVLNLPYNLGGNYDFQIPSVPTQMQEPANYNNLPHYMGACYFSGSIVQPNHMWQHQVPYQVPQPHGVPHQTPHLVHHQVLEQYLKHGIEEKPQKVDEVPYEIDESDQRIARLPSSHVKNQTARVNANNETPETYVVAKQPTSLQSADCQSTSIYPSDRQDTSEKVKKKKKKSKNRRNAYKDEPQTDRRVRKGADQKDHTKKKPVQNLERKQENSDECYHSSHTRTPTNSHSNTNKLNQQSENKPSEKCFNSDSCKNEISGNTEACLNLPARKLSEQQMLNEPTKAAQTSTEISQKQRLGKSSTAAKKQESAVESSLVKQKEPKEKKENRSSRKISDERFYKPPAFRNRMVVQGENVEEARMELAEKSYLQETENSVQTKRDSKYKEQPKHGCREMPCEPQGENAGREEVQCTKSVNKSRRGRKEKERGDQPEEQGNNEQPKQHYKQTKLFNQGDSWENKHQHSLGSERRLDNSDCKEEQHFDDTCNQFKPDSAVLKDIKRSSFPSSSEKGTIENMGNTWKEKPSQQKDYSQSCDENVNPSTQHSSNIPLPVFSVKPPPGFNPLNVPLGCNKFTNPPPGFNLQYNSAKLHHVPVKPPGFNQKYPMVQAEIKVTKTEYEAETPPTGENSWPDKYVQVLQSKREKELASTCNNVSIGSEKNKIEALNSKDKTTADSAKSVQGNKLQVIDYWDGSVVEETVDVKKEEPEQLPEELPSLDFFEEVNGDLFLAPTSCSLVHCVSEDMRMSHGIAVEFRRRYNRIAELLNQYARTGELAVLGEPQEAPLRFIYYLVTKDRSINKPNIDDLKKSLECLKQHCIRNQVKHLAMPRIGCGLDQLLWPNVVMVLKNVFTNTGIKITIYNKQTDWEKIEKLDSTLYHLTLLDDLHKSLSDMQANTARIFLANEGPQTDATMHNLNIKFKFLQNYSLKARSMGELFCYESKFPKEVLYGLVVRGQSRDKIDFLALETALKSLSKALRKENYLHIAFEAFYDETDLVAVDKVVTLMKWLLGKNGVELRVCWPTQILMHYGRLAETESTHS